MATDETSLPSYGEAVSSDWLPIVAPYIPAKYYAVLCLVSTHWYQEFAPRLWRDPLRTIRVLGLDPNDDLDWYTSFFFNHLLRTGGREPENNNSSAFAKSRSTKITRNSGNIRPSSTTKHEGRDAVALLGGGRGPGPRPGVREATRSMVLSVDFRQFATDTCDFRSDDNDRSVSKSLTLYPRTFPNLRCILLDGHADVDPTCLAQAHSQQNHHDQSQSASLIIQATHSGTTAGTTGASSGRTRGTHDVDDLRIGGGGVVSDASGALAADLHTDSHPSYSSSGSRTGSGPALLSLCRHPTHLSAKFFHSPYLHGLVYLDISHIPGSLRASVQSGSLSPAQLPSLRMLKARDREMDDTTLSLLVGSFMSRLWSLDVCDNVLSDAALDSLVSCSFTAVSRRTTHQHFEVEGMLQAPQSTASVPGSDLAGLGGDSVHGPFRFIIESDQSGTFSHPERFLADAPAYSSHAPNHEESGSYHNMGVMTAGAGTSRTNGLSPIRDDSVDHVKLVLEESAAAFSPVGDQQYSIAEQRLRDSSSGLTHLYLSGNTTLTSRGLERLLLVHPGTLQRLDCDTLAFQLPPPLPQSVRSPSPASSSSPWPWPRTARVFGVMGSSYVFRPVICSDLRELRVHHSLVTQTPSIEGPGFPSPLVRLWAAENVLAPRAEMAYPGGSWVPDMNPRISRLTLTQVPRRSSGRVIRAICKLIKAASEQEAAIRSCESGKRRGAPVLKGLRCLRLEFDSESATTDAGDTSDVSIAVDDGEGGGLSLGIDAGDLLTLGEDEFSFFKDENKRLSNNNSSSSTPKPRSKKPGRDKNQSLTPASTGDSSRTSRSDHSSTSTIYPVYPPVQKAIGTKLLHFPYSQITDPYLEYTLPSPSPSSLSTKLLVWIGTGILGPYPAVNEYMQNVQDRRLRTQVGPASPLNVNAGVPHGSYIFHAAWDAMVYPNPTRDSSSVLLPGREELAVLATTDTLAGIKAYRRKTAALLGTARRESADRKVWLGAPHYHWSGKIEVVLNTDVSNPEYWRR